jgi:rRNA maturation endonuclease Nob1
MERLLECKGCKTRFSIEWGKDLPEWATCPNCGVHHEISYLDSREFIEQMKLSYRCFPHSKM